jgi:hypothetical protein
MLRYEFIGWCHDPKENHDKVWGVIRLDESFYGKILIFWGRRGKKLQTKLDHYSHKTSALIRMKEREYNYINEARLESVYPEFRTDLEKTAVWAILSA